MATAAQSYGAAKSAEYEPLSTIEDDIEVAQPTKRIYFYFKLKDRPHVVKGILTLSDLTIKLIKNQTLRM